MKKSLNDVAAEFGQQVLLPLAIERKEAWAQIARLAYYDMC